MDYAIPNKRLYCFTLLYFIVAAWKFRASACSSLLIKKLDHNIWQYNLISHDTCATQYKKRGKEA
jgi:hypothetical protein